MDIPDLTPEEEESITLIFDELSARGWVIMVGVNRDDPKYPFLVFAKQFQTGIRYHVHSDRLHDAAEHLATEILKVE